MNDYTTRQCTKCKREYPATLEFFGRHNREPDGLRRICKQCITEYNGQYRVVGRQTPIRIKDDMKQCSKCEQWFPNNSEHFGIARHHKDGLSSQCRSCLNEKKLADHYAKIDDPHYQKVRLDYRLSPRGREASRRSARNYKDNHPERVAQKQHEYDMRPERKAKKRVYSSKTRAMRRNAEGEYTKGDVETQYQSQGELCWWCGKKLNGKYEIDHRIPLSRGGTNWPNNIVCACKKCNRRKHDKMPWEWNGRLL